MKLTTSRLKRLDAASYVHALRRSQFCLCPTGDGPTPGQRLFDAIAAGCVPIIIGSDRAALPFAHVVDYGKFAGFLSRTSFVKDPRFACEALLHKLRPALPALQRALSDARHWLVYGSVAGGNFSAQTRFGDVAPMLLREVSAAIATGTP